MKVRHKFLRSIFAVFLALAMCIPFIAGCTKSGGDDEIVGGDEEYSPIKSVLALGFIDKDGPKVNGIALEYDTDMEGATITNDTYILKLFDSSSNINLGSGKIGDITKWYISGNAEIDDSAVQGGGSGKYVILEVYTDYLSNSESSYKSSMIVYVTQDKDITLKSGEVITKGNVSSTNATVTKKVNEITGNVTTTTKLDIDGFVIPEIQGFKYYTDNTEFGEPDGPAYVVENCFNQQDGLYYDIHLSYAIYVPEDYEARGGKDGKWAMVTLQNPAADPGTHPFVSVLQTRSPAYYATTGQDVVKAQGLDGLIVVVPVVTQRVNDNGGTPAEYEAIVNLWDDVIEEYGVDKDHIYGSGQSVGGMILIETQRNRDNFFAGLLLYEDQWAQNYYVDTLFVRNMASVASTAAKADMHYPRTTYARNEITWDYHYDNDGNIVTVEEGHDPYNMYYLISDDNMLVMRTEVNNLSIDNWNEMSFLYQDLTGDTANGINQLQYSLKSSSSSTAESLAQENQAIEDFLSNVGKDGATRNINTITFMGDGGNGYSIRMYDATYEWLLTQSRETEMTRNKLDLNKPFVAASEEEQLASQTEERKLHFSSPYLNEDGSRDDLYFIKGQLGAGTQFYNTGWYNLLTVADAAPGWLPDGMGSWTDGAQVTGASIVSAQVIEGGKAVAIEYSCDMSNLAVNLKGDPILAYGSTDTYLSNLKIEVDPFTFYDADGKEIQCVIKSVYVSTTASATDEGEGCYVIVEFETALGVTPSYLIQRTTLHTDKYIASALPWHYAVTD